MVIAFSAAKGGVSKTSLAINVAAQWARAGRRVCVLDLDTTQKNAAWFGPGLQVLGVPIIAANRATAKGHLKACEGSIVLLDTGPSVTPEMAVALSLADVAVCPISELLSLINVPAFLEIADDARKHNPKLQVLYAMTMQDRRTGHFSNVEAAARARFGDDVLTATTRDLAPWKNAPGQKQDVESFAPGSEAAHEARVFAEELWQKTYGNKTA